VPQVPAREQGRRPRGCKKSVPEHNVGVSHISQSALCAAITARAVEHKLRHFQYELPNYINGVLFETLIVTQLVKKFLLFYIRSNGQYTSFLFYVTQGLRPCHGWGLQSPASHRGGPGQSMWDMWWTKWHWDRFFSEFFGFPPSIYHSIVTLQTHIIWGMRNMLT
jgi:hypothetical protein